MTTPRSGASRTFDPEEFAARLGRAAESLQVLADEIAHDDSPDGKAYRATDRATRHHARLLGKREGVLLALSYFRNDVPASGDLGSSP